MKRFCLVVVMLCMGLFAGIACAQSASLSAQQQIEAVEANMGRAAKAHDAKRFMAAFQHGPELAFAFNGRVIHGWDALYAQQLKWWRGGKSDVVYRPTTATEFLQLAPDAWVTTATLSSRRTGPDGKPAVGTFTVTSIWRKFADGWRIVYGHESWVR
ncbi:nuclear transport factor 2 family protein [Rhodanobacter sp. B05]|uniref:YybH family protein n=1 Tax=Rhodanobacter sp. B05 TaxID=1945859 RepID=UPI00098505E1|nr:nuclear transport factor 2 family protein [Rhodanobacter sp. B05]